MKKRSKLFASFQLVMTMKKLSDDELNYIVKVGNQILEKRAKKGIKVVK